MDTGNVLHPCEYFDLIVASGAGAVIGILLAVLRLSTQDAMEAFVGLCTQVFPPEGCQPSARTDLLESAINKLLTVHSIPLDTSFEDTKGKFNGSCRLAIGYLSTANIAACRLLRNYPTRSAPVNMTIAQAIKLAWATPGLFSPVFVGPDESRGENLISSVNGYNNPTLVAIKEAFDLFGPDARVSCLLSLGSGKAAVRSLGATESDVYSTLEQLAVDCEATAEEVQRRIGSLGVYSRFSVERGLEFIRSEDGVNGILSHTKIYLEGDAVSAAMDNCLRTAEFPSAVTLEQLFRARPRGLASSHGLPPLSAFYVPRPAVMQAMVATLLDSNDLGQRVMIISGLGGSGKTQCVLKFCREYEDSYQHILFIDASSAETIKSSLIAREIAAEIVQQLGYLPVAIVQAGCYIKSQHCLRQYTMRLKHNRRKLLDRPARTREKLKYDHSVYAAFDVTLDVLSPKSRQLLNILSMVHYADFPQPLIAAAAKSHFEYEMCQLLDRPPNYQDTVELLREIFCPEEIFDDDELVDMLDELQQYSLVSLVSTGAIVTLRLHPLVHSWARDRMTPDEAKKYHDAAIRLIASVADWDNILLFPHLSIHVRTLVSSWEELHPNDAVAFAQFLGFDDDCDTRFRVLSEIYEKIRSQYGDKDVRTSRIALELADAYGEVEDVEKMEEMEREAVSIREELLGRDHLETLTALANLASTLNDKGEYDESLKIREEVLATAIRTTGPTSRRSADAMEALAATYNCLNRFKDQGQYMEKLLISVIDILKESLGQIHQYTIETMADLSDCYGSQERHEEASKLQKEILHLERSAYGMQHEGTLSTMEWIAKTMMDQQKYKEAEALWLQAIQTRRLMKDPDKVAIANDMAWLARAYRQQQKYADAEALSQEELNLRVELQDDSSVAYCDALSWLCRELQDQKKYEKLPSLTEELLMKRRAILGDDHIDTCVALGWRGIAAFYEGKHKLAEEMRRQEFEKRKRLQGTAAIEVWNAASWLGRALHDQKRYYDAEVLRREELEGRKKVTGVKHSEYLVSLSWLIQSLIDQNKVADLDDLTTELLEGRLETAGPRAPDTLLAKQYKARSRLLEGKNQEGLDMLLSLLGEQLEVLGPSSHSYLNTMRYIAQAEYELGHNAESSKWRLEEIAGRKQAQGENSGDYLNSLSWVVRCLCELENWSEMEEHSRDLVKGRLALNGAEHSDTLNARQWLARAYFHGAKYDLAKVAFTELVEDWTKLEGPKNQHTLDCIGWLSRVNHAQCQWEEALRLREEEIEGRKSWNEPPNEALANAQSWLVQLLGELGRLEEMERLAWEVFEDRKAIPSTLPSLLTSEKWVARAYFENEKYEQSLEILERIAQSRLDLHGKSHVEYLNVTAWISRILWVLGRLEEAESLRTEELALRVATQGEMDSAVRESTNWMVRILVSAGRQEEARTLAAENVEKARRDQGSGSLATLRSRLALAEVLMKEKVWNQAMLVLKELLAEAGSSTSAEDQVLVPSAKMRLALCHYELGDCNLALPLAEEAFPLLSRRIKKKSPNTTDLRDFMDLVEAGGLRASSHPTSGSIDEPSPRQVPTLEPFEDTNNEEAPDPDDLETVDSSPAPQAAGLSISRQLTPFSQRESFGRRPNNWSMFF
ncbi:SubName: Full=Uncharacterized protein {ECO:0000313/EMBL:CCA68726.1} [Serendipita indica DSM 11827]|nr:SubName: Full=Uncharacterized protein {ECO:0000313/EMBL:CCA68726.1} [Serendipita indica DSM 11827]